MASAVPWTLAPSHAQEIVPDDQGRIEEVRLYLCCVGGYVYVYVYMFLCLCLCVFIFILRLN